MYGKYYVEPSLESRSVFLNKFQDRIFSQLTLEEFKKIEGVISKVLSTNNSLRRNYPHIVVTPRQSHDIKVKLLEEKQFDISDKLLFERDMYAFVDSCKTHFRKKTNDVSLFIDYCILVKQGHLPENKELYNYIKTFLKQKKPEYIRFLNAEQGRYLSFILEEKEFSDIRLDDIDQDVFEAKDFEAKEKLEEAVQKFGEILYYRPAREGLERLLGKCLESCDEKIIRKYFNSIGEYGLFDGVFFESLFEKLRNLDAERVKKFYQILSNIYANDYFVSAVRYKLKQLGYWGASDKVGVSGKVSGAPDYFNVKEQMARLEKYDIESIFKRQRIIESLSKTPIYHRIPGLEEFYDSELNIADSSDKHYSLKTIIEKINILFDIYPMFDRALKRIKDLQEAMYEYEDYKFVLFLGKSQYGKSHLYVSLKSEVKLTKEQIQASPEVNNNIFSNGTDLLDFYFDHPNKVCYIDSIGVNDSNCSTLNSKSCAILISLIFFRQYVYNKISKICLFLTNDKGADLIDFLGNIFQYISADKFSDIKLLIPYNIEEKKIKLSNFKGDFNINNELPKKISQLLEEKKYFKIKEGDIDTEEFKKWVVKEDEENTKEKNEVKIEECQISLAQSIPIERFFNSITYVFNSIAFIERQYQKYRQEQYVQSAEENKEQIKIPFLIEDLDARIKELKQTINNQKLHIDKLNQDANIYILREPQRSKIKKHQKRKKINLSQNCRGDYSISSKDLSEIFSQEDEDYKAITREGPNFYGDHERFTLKRNATRGIDELFHWHISVGANVIQETKDGKNYLTNHGTRDAVIKTLIRQKDLVAPSITEIKKSINANEAELSSNEQKLKSYIENGKTCSEDYLQKRSRADKFKIVKQQIEKAVREIDLNGFFHLLSKENRFKYNTNFRNSRLAFIVNSSVCEIFSRYKLFKNIFRLKNEEEYNKVLKSFIDNTENITAYNEFFIKAIQRLILTRDIGSEENPSKYIIKTPDFKELIDYLYDSSCEDEQIFNQENTEEVIKRFSNYAKIDKRKFFSTSEVKGFVEKIINAETKPTSEGCPLYTYIKSKYSTLIEIFSIILASRICWQKSANENTGKDATLSKDSDQVLQDEEFCEYDKRIETILKEIIGKNPMIFAAKCVTSKELLNHFACHTKQKIQVVNEIPQNNSREGGVTYIEIRVMNGKGNDLFHARG